MSLGLVVLFNAKICHVKTDTYSPMDWARRNYQLPQRGDYSKQLPVAGYDTQGDAGFCLSNLGTQLVHAMQKRCNSKYCESRFSTLGISPQGWNPLAQPMRLVSKQQTSFALGKTNVAKS